VNLNLGGPALEVAISLSFVFFLLSVIASAVTEGIAGLRKWRAKTLEEGIRGLLGHKDTANAVLQHPLVRTDLGLNTRRSPSYISSHNFGLALMDVLTRGSCDDSTDPLKLVEGKVRELGSNSDLATQLRALLAEADTSVARFRRSLEHWFDDSMDRVSGWYKRKSQIVMVFVAAAVTLSLNVSSVRLVERLVAEPAVRSAVVSKAEAALEKGENNFKASENIEEGTSLKAAGKGIEKANTELASLKLPILWSHANSPFKSWTVFALALAGWLITIAAISLGAPFWFDALGKLAHLRTTGKKPEPQT
jgi:hypothetical protein